MISDSASLFHAGINWLMSPSPTISRRKFRAFQEALDEFTVDYEQAKYGDQAIVFGRSQQSSLEIKIAQVPGAIPIGHLLIVSPNARQTIQQFRQDAKATTHAFERVWPEQRQFITRDVTIRYLYESESEHAFKELWEGRFKQTDESLKLLGRPLWGGGLRFVLPPLPDEPEPCSIEVKIESFLENPKKMFVETVFKWLNPQEPGSAFDADRLISTVDSYIDNHVLPFINGAPK
ncbi:MAG: hypothetical protein HZB53_16970 [Chloroflexi bacterium]|nr:hypothetical protein [Chloroflexota bacterium]